MDSVEELKKCKTRGQRLFIIRKGVETTMKIAYICTGLNPKCSGKVGCFKQQGAVFDDSIVCTHTLDPKYAKYDICEDPEPLVGERFERYVMPDGEIRYFEIAGSQ